MVSQWATHTGRREPPPATWQRSRVLASIALGILPLLLLAAANLWRQVQEGEQRVAEDRIALARAAALTVSGFVDTSFATLQTLAATPTLANPTSRPELTDLLTRAREADSPLAVIGLFRADGWNVALAGLDQPPLTLNVLDRQYVQQARSTDQRVVSPATIPRTTGALTVDLVIPVDFVTGERGVLSGSLALTRLGEQLRALPGSSSVQIVLVDTDGQVILHPDPNVVRSVTSLRGQPEVEAVLVGQTGSLRTVAQDGSDELVAYAPVPGYGWGVLIVQPVSTAFALVRRDLLLALGLLGLIVALVGLMGWLLGGRLHLAYLHVVQAKTQAESAQAQAEAAQHRLAFLAEASRILGSSLEDETTLRQVADLAVPSLGDRCRIDLIDGHSSAAKGDGTADAAEKTRQRLGAEAISSMRVVMPDRTDTPGMAGLAVPLLAGGRVLGALTCLRTDGRPYAEADLALATELADRVALAVDNVRLYHAAQRAIQDRDEFLSVAAHELKTPITSLRGYAQLALRRIEAREATTSLAIQKALEVIELQSGKLNRLISQLLDISRLEAGRLTLTRECVDLVPVIEMLIERTRMLSEQHTIILDAPPTATANVDLLRFEQVVSNLLDNAIKYSPQGGKVRVSVTRPAPDRLCVSIQDQGVGIPPERREHIFERFYQAHAELLHSAMAGMGLGLYISRQIVELHEGSIEAEFPDEGGVRFVITLP
ncbi:MAG TPA: ATP-binding protein [Chloroflexota bacterium]